MNIRATLIASCLIATSLVPGAAQAVTANFASTVSSGDFAGSLANGTFTYNSASLIGVGKEYIYASQGLTVELHVFGQTFTETDDIDYSLGLPALEFLDGNAILLDFYVSETQIPTDSIYIEQNLTAINLASVNGFGLFTLNAIAENKYDGNFSVSSVPEAQTYALMLAGLGLIGWRALRNG